MAEAHSNKNIPFGVEVMEFILLERLLRYPDQPDATTNFDAGAGMLLFEWLLQDSQSLHETEKGLDIDLDACAARVSALAENIELIEATEDAAEYRRLAKDFVRTLLPVGIEGARFAIPSNYTRLVQVYNKDMPILSFDGLLS